MTTSPLVRIGLSATQKPIADVARYLVGAGNLADDGRARCAIVDEGHRRDLDLTIELPSSPLEAVMSGEVWTEIYDRLAELVEAHRTTLVFVNTRRLAERVARHLSERVGDGEVTAHHGSLARDVRLDAEARLREGRLKALVATASLELGIDIGAVDLVCQLGSTRRISTLLQRVGRADHTVAGIPKGRLFPLSRDELLECAALLRGVREGWLEHSHLVDKPRDVLAQQIVAESACEDWPEDALFALLRRAYPYRDLSRSAFDEVVQMLAHGFATRRGRRGAFVHYDAVGGGIRGRRGARLVAITCGGAIPDNADFRVVQEPEGIFVGTLNEDFAIESLAGDVFQLGNTSWRILRVEAGVVRVEDARGQPPSIPFWIGEAPGRSKELSEAVSGLRADVASRLDDRDDAIAWLRQELGLPAAAALQIVEYLAETKRLLGVMPTQRTLVAERFFDEAGGMQLVIHAPFGSRINRAWGLALRKRFCRQFNFELQAAATEDALVLSLGPQHSFPLGDVFKYLHPNTAETVLVQALLDAPMFQTRWRWASTISLAILRNRGGRKTAPQIQRMQAEDLLAAVFPDAAACLENIAGDREIPDHPLVRQAIEDCLHEAMDIDGLKSILERIQCGDLACIARDTPEPSPLSHETLNARPYAFLDDAPLEERRTQAVYTRRAFEPSSAADLGALDAAAIDRVREEAWPAVADLDELHDALLVGGFLTDEEVQTLAGEGGEGGEGSFSGQLLDARRAGRVPIARDRVLWFAAERLGEIRAVYPDGLIHPADLQIPSSKGSLGTGGPTDRSSAIRELLRSRLEIVGPTTAAAVADTMGVAVADIDAALVALEAEGVVLRGAFTPDGPGGTPGTLEWCDRRLLARIHRYTLNRLRAEIEPVSTADFMRFLFVWQHVDPEHRVAGVEGLAAVVAQLDGFELAGGAWEPDVLTSRCDEYDPLMLDTLCLTGRVAWARVSPPLEPGSGPFVSGPLRSTPIALFLREHTRAWLGVGEVSSASLSSDGSQALAVLQHRGASFFHEIVTESGLLPTQVERAMGELVALGVVTADSFAGLRALLIPSSKRRLRAGGRRKHRTSPFGVESAGRWVVLRPTGESPDGRSTREQPEVSSRTADSRDVEVHALTLLRRYGVVCRRLLMRETTMVSWRELLREFRRLEARGEIRGGRFVAGMSGEQFALPEAVGQLRAIRRSAPAGELFGISAADPLNLTGIVTPGDRIPALVSNRVVYRNGVPVAAREGGEFRALADFDSFERHDIELALVRSRVGPTLRAYLGNVG